MTMPVASPAPSTKNMLVRINRELDASFDVEAFRHLAVWNGEAKRVEMHLEAQNEHTVSVAGRDFAFAEGETIHTENSHKYTIADFAALAERGRLAHRPQMGEPGPAIRGPAAGIATLSRPWGRFRRRHILC